MAHHTTNRRILASSSSLGHPPTTLASPINPPTSNSMDPTLKKHNPKPTSTKNPDPILSSKPFYMSKTINPNHKTTQKPTTKHHHHPTCVDIHLQTKSMTVSADFDASRFSFIKPKHQNHTKRVTELKGEEFDKVKKVSSAKGSVVVVEDKKKVEEKKRNELILPSPGTVKDLVDVKRMPSSVPLIRGGGGRRRSFCGSQVELADFLASNGAKVVSVDMPPFMQSHAIDCARKTHDSLEKFTSKALACTLKKEFDGVYGPAWHCIVGTSFGSFVTHSVGGFLYFSMDQKLYILLFKTTVQRAD